MEKHCVWTYFDNDLDKPVFCGKDIVAGADLCETHSELAKTEGMKECNLGHGKFWGDFCPICWHITFESVDLTAAEDEPDLALALQHCIDALEDALAYVEGLGTYHEDFEWKAVLKDAQAALQSKKEAAIVMALQEIAGTLEEAVDYVESLDRTDHTAGLWGATARDARLALKEEID
ncbi:MAG: hypothetical protein HY326_07320 [Chloroflexi bacterium]|nr:hypothetical protein [Chloroflexota bacterium]